MGITPKQKQALAEANRESNRLTREAIRQALYLLSQKKTMMILRLQI
ncbi:hypothetical protein [Terrisporobacter sp.]